MSVSDEYLAYVIEQFEGLGALRAKRMFGGVGVYCDEWFFAILVDDELYLKVDDVNRVDYAKRGLKPFTYGTKSGRTQTMSYYPVPVRVLEDREALAVWAGKSIDAAQRAKR